MPLPSVDRRSRPGLQVFEVDEPGRAQAWKRRRLIELGFGVPEWLHLLLSRQAKAGGKLSAAGVDSGQPAVVVSTGVSNYLNKDANAATLRQIIGLAPGSISGTGQTYRSPCDWSRNFKRPSPKPRTTPGRQSRTPAVVL